MRDIKFRAFRKGKMYNGLSLEKLLAISKETGFAENAPSEVVWMQYTGLKDKTGKEIYEDDILGGAGYTRKRLKVVYDQDNCKFIGKTFDGYVYYLHVGEKKYIKIIGNIHENPELLGESDG